MKHLLLAMTVSIVLSLPVVAVAGEEPAAAQLKQESDFKHDHRKSKGMPSDTNKRDMSAGEESSGTAKSEKKHDHRKSKGMPSDTNKRSMSAGEESSDTAKSENGHDHGKMHK